MKDDNEAHNKPNDSEVDVYQQPPKDNDDEGMLNRYSSVENGEVRDEGEYEDYGGG